MSLLEKTKVTHYIFIKNLYMNEYFINKKSKTHTHTQEVQESKLYSSKKKKGLERGQVKSQEEKTKCSIRELVNVGGSNFYSKCLATFFFHIQQHFHACFLFISKRQVLSGPRWKMHGPIQKIPPPLIKQHTNSFSLLFSPKNSSLYRRLYRFNQWNVYFDTSQYQYTISDLPLFFIFINMCVCVCVCVL